MERLELDKTELEEKLVRERRIEQLDSENKLEMFENLRNSFADEMRRKDQIIEQQRAMIRALSLKLTNDMKNPI